MWKYIVFVAVLGVIVYYTVENSNGCEYNPVIRLDDKVVIVTGANAGIGKETVKDLVQRGARVYLGCRSLDKGQAAMKDIQKNTGVDPDRMILLHLDLASLQSVRTFVKEFKKRESMLDILINNGGIMFPPNNITIDGYEVSFATNHLGHFLLTHLLSDVLIESAPSRIVHVSSLGHLFASMKFDDLMTERFQGYSFLRGGWSYIHSKLANILFSNELARRLQGTGVTSYSLHPGSVKSGLPQHDTASSISYTIFGMFMKDNYHGARTSVYCAIEPGLEKLNGKYFSDCGEASPSSAAQNVEDARTLWDASVQLVHLQPDEIHPKLLHG